VELEDLDKNERLALLALLQRVVAADRQVNDGETNEIATLMEAFGDEDYLKTLDEASERFQDDESLKKFLPTIVRPEARELIVGTLLEAAIPGAVEGHESELLEWLEDTWDIEVAFEQEPAE
jgi:uncharacterized tellurite resistance protein B-like protein